MKKCYLFQALTITLLSLLWTPAKADNLAPNPGFEEWPEKPEEGVFWGASEYAVGAEGREGAPDGITYRSGDGELDQEKHSGSYAQYIQTHTYGRGATTGGISVFQGNRYRVSVWAKVVTGTFRLNVCMAQPPWTYLGDWVEGQADGEWRQFSMEVNIPEKCEKIAVTMFFQQGSGYLDDLEVIDLGLAENVQTEGLPLLQGRLAEKISRLKVAIFDEPGFPTESPRTPEWYEKTLQQKGFHVERLRLSQIRDAKHFNIRKFDTLILPTGGNMPADMEASLVDFLAAGGVVLIDGNMVMRSEYQAPVEVQTRLNELKQAYENGGDAREYWDYVSKNATEDYANVFMYDKERGVWRNKLTHHQSYEYINFEPYLQDLNLTPWPNTGQAQYARVFSEAVHRNPAAGEILAGLPETIPADNHAKSLQGALRLKKPGERGHGSRLAEEYALDLLLPLYVFSEPSGNSYPSFPDAGKHPKDCETDFYVVRYNNPVLKGGTLVHFGNAGKRLLASEDGAETLAAVLRIAESELPGEVPKEYAETVNSLRHVFSAYSGVSLEYRDICAKLARLDFYQNRQNEVASLRGAIADERSKFEDLSLRNQELEKLLFSREQDCVWGHEARLALIEELKNESTQLQAELPKVRQRLSAQVTEPVRNAIRHPLDRIYLGLGNARNGRGEPQSDALRQRVEAMGLRWEGYAVSSYRHEYTFNTHPFKSTFESGTLDPKTGVVEPVSFSWMTTDEERELWIRSFQWQLERAAADPSINLVFGFDERNMAFSLWGEREHALFISHLTKKYGTIDALNKVWNTTHTSFEEIQLPVTKPETQSEHALWEDWARYREIYRYEDEMMPSITSVTRYAPELLYLTWSTNYLIDRSPASGINFYEYGKILYDHTKFKINGFEHANTPDKEWFTFDIASMYSRNCTAEWGTFYFAPSGHQEKVDLLSETLWNGIVNGQVGWDLFQISAPGALQSSYFDMANLPLPLGWQLALLNTDIQKLAPVVLDGVRDEPQVRIVYSNTNLHHTAWPDVEGDISYRAVGGLYDFFKRIHTQARAIDEQAVWEGALPKECRLLILPEVTFQNEKLFKAVVTYLEKGGSVLVTAGSGVYDEYGRQKDSWSVLAGVKPVTPENPIIPLDEGMTYFSAAHRDRMVGLELLFPEETKVFWRYESGEAALAHTRIGQGNLFVFGADLGQDSRQQWASRPEVVARLLKPVFEVAGIEDEVDINISRIFVRPWTYEGRRFLFITDPGRTGMQDFEMKIAGDWKVTDYLLGVEIPSVFDGKSTHIKGIIPSPGGVVYALDNGNRSPSQKAVTAVEAPASSLPPASEDRPLTLPFEGRIWVDKGKVDIGEFSVDLDVETGGGWGGEMFVTVSHAGVLHRRLCEKGKTLIFELPDKRLAIEVQEITTVYPGNMLCKIEASSPARTETDCTVVEEKFLGQDSILVSNGIIAFRLLPALGGRMIELLSLPDGVNHMAVDEKLVTEGVGSGWSDFGGMGENAGGWPGPFWNQPFQVTDIQQTPDVVRLRLEMKTPVEWTLGHGKPTGGKNRLVKEFTLKKGSAQVSVKLENHNAHDSAYPTGLRTHPAFRIGGAESRPDMWLVSENGVISSRKLLGDSTQFNIPAEVNWTALVDEDQKMAMLNTFDANVVDSIYLNSNNKKSNLELWHKVTEVPANGHLEFSHSLALIRGLAGVTACKENIVVNLILLSGNRITSAKPVKFAVETGSWLDADVVISASIHSKEGLIKNFEPIKTALVAGRAVAPNFSWEPAEAPDGEYHINVKVSDAGGREILSVEKPFAIVRKMTQGSAQRMTEYQEKLKALRQSDTSVNTKSSDASPRARLVRGEILFDELKKAVQSGNQKAAENVEKQLREVLE